MRSLGFGADNIELMQITTQKQKFIFIGPLTRKKYELLLIPKDKSVMCDKVNIMGKDLRPNCAGQLKNQRGSAAVDYAVILVFVVLVVIVVIVALQDRSEVIFKATGSVIGNFGKT